MGKKKGGRGRLWLGALAGLAAGALGVTVLARRGGRGNESGRRGAGDRWARPGMSVTFRAELMPGRDRAERTYRVAELLANNRVTLDGVAGEHTETEFEPSR